MPKIFPKIRFNCEESSRSLVGLDILTNDLHHSGIDWGCNLQHAALSSDSLLIIHIHCIKAPGSSTFQGSFAHDDVKNTIMRSTVSDMKSILGLIYIPIFFLYEIGGVVDLNPPLPPLGVSLRSSFFSRALASRLCLIRCIPDGLRRL